MNKAVAVQGDRRMTVREVAEALGVSEQTIRYHARNLYPELVKNGVTTLLNEEHVTAIKSLIGTGRNDLQNILQVKNAITDLEAAEMLLKSAEHFKARFEQEQALRQAAEGKLAIAEPKAEILDKITATDSDISVRELASVLAVPHLGQNNLFERLREDGYIDGFNRPYRRYVESGLIYEKEYYVPQLDATKRQLRITQKGVAYFARKYGQEEEAV